MGTVAQLYNTLTARFQGGQKNISSTDFPGDGGTVFTGLFGNTPLEFSADSALGAVANETFTVTGKLDLWNLGLLDFVLTIENNAGEAAFTLVPVQPLSNWHFARSFPDLQNSYLDYLELDSCFLIATGFTHDWAAPITPLKTGLNFYGTARVSEAIASLQALYPTLSTINIRGTISNSATPRLVDLRAPLPDPNNNTTDAVFILDYDSRKSEADNLLGEINEKLHSSNFIFNQVVQVPLEESALTKVYQILLHKLQDDREMHVQNTDMGGMLAAKFTTVLGIDNIEFTEAAITRSDTVVEVTGKTALFGLPKSTVFHVRIVSNLNSLELVAYPDALPPDWKFSTSFPQTRNSFFDDLAIQNLVLIASSYGFQHTNPAVAVVQGLNLYVQTANIQALERLQELGSAYQSISLQGTAIPSGTSYTLTLKTLPGQDLSLQLLGLQPITFQAPLLTLQSDVDAGGATTNVAFLRGTCITSGLTYPARMLIPVDGGPYIQLSPIEPTLGLANIVGVLSLSAAQNLSPLFPAEFVQLNTISVQGPAIYFTALGAKKTITSSTMTLVDAGGQPRVWQLLSSPDISVGNLRVGVDYGYFGYDEANRDFIFRGTIGGTIVIGSTSAVDISLLLPLSGDWLLSVVGASIPSLSDIASFIGRPQSQLTAPLPNNLYQTGQATTLSEIQIGFNPFTPSLSFVSFAFQQGERWEILPNFSVEGWKVFLKTDATQHYAVTGHLHGFVKIGTVVNIEADLPIPAGAQGWTLGLKEGTSIQFPSIGEILSLSGADPSGLPDSFTTFGAFDIADLAINFNPSPATINWFRFAMQGQQDWVLIGPKKLVISDIAASLTITRKAGGGFESVGEISGRITIFDSQIWVAVTKAAPDQPWQLGVMIPQPIHIPGLKNLASWMMKADMTRYIPDEFMPFGQGFDLTDLTILFDLSHNTLQSAQFTIINSAKWTAIPGILSFDNVLLKATISHINQPDQALSVHIECLLNVGSANIRFYRRPAIGSQ